MNFPSFKICVYLAIYSVGVIGLFFNLSQPYVCSIKNVFKIEKQLTINKINAMKNLIVLSIIALLSISTTVTFAQPLP
ncbi:MAG: hypothetical protein ACPGXZ_09325, partial [Saprospiraceae bacterium]